MRKIKYTTRFQRDYRREKSGRHSKLLDALLMEAVNLLADMPLPLMQRRFVHFDPNRIFGRCPGRDGFLSRNHHPVSKRPAQGNQSPGCRQEGASPTA
jgi:hypothetical protein